jgi:Tfp pilus assembly protein PilZ
VQAKTERLDPEAPIPLVHPLPARAPEAQAVQIAPVQTVAEAPALEHYPPAPPPPAERPAPVPGPSAPQPTVPMFAGAAAQLPTTQVSSVDPHGQTSYDHAQAARAAQVAPAPTPAPSAAPAAPAGDVREVELGAMSESNFYKGLSGPDVIEHGGIFVATYKIPPVGSQVTLRVHLPSKGQPLEFTARAIVRWTRESRDGSGAPGFGARFVPNGLSSEGRNLVYRYARNREPMFYDDDL